MMRSIVLLMVAMVAFGQEQQPPIQDLTFLIGKQVTVQRVPLCRPGTYAQVLSTQANKRRSFR
jgi:hypothetical protein